MCPMFLHVCYASYNGLSVTIDVVEAAASIGVQDTARGDQRFVRSCVCVCLMQTWKDGRLTTVEFSCLLLCQVSARPTRPRNSRCLGRWSLTRDTRACWGLEGRPACFCGPGAQCCELALRWSGPPSVPPPLPKRSSPGLRNQQGLRRAGASRRAMTCTSRRGPLAPIGTAVSIPVL